MSYLFLLKLVEVAVKDSNVFLITVWYIKSYYILKEALLSLIIYISRIKIIN